MLIVTERFDGTDSLTPFWCENKANTLRDKIIAKGGEAEVSEVCYE